METKVIILRFVLIVSLLIFSFNSCEKDKNDNKKIICGTINPIEELEWLKNLIGELESGHNKSEIYLYEYKEEKVFFIDKCINCPDGIAEVYDCDSNVICVFGGYMGINTCPDFDSLAVKDSLLWKNY
jgi:hypothetical protein